MIGQLAARDTGVAANPYYGWNKIPYGFGNNGSSGLYSTGAMCGNPLGSFLLLNMLGASEAMANNMLRWFENTYLPTNAAYVDYASGTWTPSAGAITSSNSPLNNAPKVRPMTTTCHGAHTRWKIASESWIIAKGGDRANTDRCRKCTYATVYKLVELINQWKLGSPAIDSSLDPTTGATAAGCKQTGCHASTVGGYPETGVGGKMKCTPCHTQRIGDGHNL